MRRRFRRVFFGTRRRRIVAVFAAALLSTGGAIGAYVIINQIVSGSATGQFAQAPTLNALVISPSGTDVAAMPCTAGSGASCTGGTIGTIPYTVTNNDSVNKTWNGGSYTMATSGHPECDSHLFVTSNPPTGPYPPGATTNYTLGQATTTVVTFKADPSTPLSCSTANITATFTGTTS